MALSGADQATGDVEGPDLVCHTTFHQTNFRRSDLACYPGPWRTWCKSCRDAVLDLVDDVDELEEVVDEVVRATGKKGTGSNQKRLHVPMDELEGVL